MNIRIATTKDVDGIRDVHLDAFDESENETVAALAVELLLETSQPQIVSFIAEVDDVLVGHISFSPVNHMESKRLVGYILAPLAIQSGFQKEGIGSQLVAHGLLYLRQQGIPIVFVYGDPQYYGRFGFSVDAARGYAPPYPLVYELGWQGVILSSRDELVPSGSIECVESLSKPELW